TCDPDSRGTALMPLANPKSMIASRASSFAACPSWILHPTPPAERGELTDDSLEERFVDTVRRGRESLIALFAAASREYPDNDWIVGQRVRLLVDQVDYDRAAAAVAECQPSRWWCTLLDVFVRGTR